MKVAIIHDWVFERRGGEKVLERILNMYPGAHLYYLFGNPEKILKLKHNHKFIPSFLNTVPFIAKFYKWLLPLLPVAIESFNLSSYDLVISTSSCVAKGVVPPPLGKHVCYIHSPMRYAWDQEHAYFKKKPSFFNPLELLRRILLSRMRVWDVTSSIRIDKLIANSEFVARRCALYYGKEAEVIHPPIEVNFFNPSPENINFQTNIQQTRPAKVLIFGAWVPYKKMGEALEFLIKNNIPVIAAGHGTELLKCAKQFKGKAEFFISPKDEELPALFARAKTLLFPAIEDFGIVPLEATASGMWVVAPNQGGTKETVAPFVTGFTFNASNNVEMLAAVKQSLARDILSEDLLLMKKHVAKFSCEVFDEKMCAVFKTYSNNLSKGA